MKRVLITLLCAVLLASCATPAIDYSKSPNVISSNAEYYAAQGIVPTGGQNNAGHMAARGIVPEPVPPPLPMTSTPPPQPGVSGWDVLGAAILFPLLLPVAMITSYPSYSGVHCRSYTYKDQYHVKCY